ncbi:MAG: dTDP-4-dehydrorhamnose 3,5-epimerase [Alphaproteobacteria bacterium]|nr:dTDP-4-dehydrorhamnose 3,5-epimerase [Candidatus Parcubacteria bacterium]NCQ67547.1 dTDP-4-dehydrorhamnose 3,5-epimerase [Alphaproteobacteria bacterium]
MEVVHTKISGVILFKPRFFQDNRGSLYESWRYDSYKEHGLCDDFLQDNISLSSRHVLRGLHLQLGGAEQGQILTPVDGEVFDVCVDIRKTSPTFGQYVSFNLRAEQPCQVYMPPGIAHGYCVLSERAILHYKCTKYYTPQYETGILWNDPQLNIKWPISNPILSEKDEKNITFQKFMEIL